MPANYDEYTRAFTDLTGTSGEPTHIPGRGGHDREIGGAEEWWHLFQETGVDFDSHSQTIDAFENFLISFYPTEEDTLSPEEWFYLREEFYEMYGIDSYDIDWEDYRTAIGYGKRE